MKGFGPSSYGDAFADVYDEWYGDVSDVDATVDTLRRIGGNGPFLELGIGTGRIALALAATGVRVTGIDSSNAMLERLRTKLAQNPTTRPSSIDLIQGDMVDDLPGGPYATAFIAYNTIFSLGSVESQRRLFTEVARRLVPGGAFVVEAAVPDTARPAGDTIAVRTLDVDRVVLSIDVHDPTSQIVEGHFVEFTEAAGVRLRPWRIRYSTTAELDEMALAAGFEIVDRWENMRGDPFGPDSDGHVSVYVTAKSPSHLLS